MPALPADQIERIVLRQEYAPRSHRNLTLERQLDTCSRFLAQEQAQVDPMAIREVDEVVLDAQGNPKLDKAGFPVVEKRKYFARGLAGQHWKKQIKQVRATYRAWLQRSNAERAEDADRHRWQVERDQRERNIQQHAEGEAAKARYRDSEFMQAGRDRDY